MKDNRDLDLIQDILENMEDEVLATKLLSSFNAATSRFGKLVRNLDETIPHEEWKKKCDEAQNEINVIVKEIKKYR